MTGKDIIYWDTCIFIHLLKGDAHNHGDAEGIRDSVQRFENGEIILATSSITLTEVLQATFKSERDELVFEQLTRHPRFMMISVTPEIAKAAGKLRSRKSSDDKSLSTPDAIHLATALHSKARFLYTSDAGKTGKSLGLIPATQFNLSITICKPVPPMKTNLFTATPQT